MEKICEWCKKPFETEKTNRFCSRKCCNQRNFQIARDKRDANPNYKVWNKDKTAETDERVKKISEKVTKIRKTFGYFHKIPGIDFGWKKGNVPYNKGIPNPGASKNFWAKGKNTHFSLTKPHRKVKDFLIEENIYDGFISESYLKANKKVYHPDEINVNKKKIIEIFGDLWHYNPIHYCNNSDDFIIKHVGKSIKEVRNYDLEKINNYKLEGYNSIIIWEYDINNNFEEVKEKLRRFVSET